MRRTQLLHDRPPVPDVRAPGVRNYVYRNDGPHRLDPVTGVVSGPLGDSAILGAPGEDVVITVEGTIDRANGLQIVTQGRHLQIIGGKVAPSKRYAATDDQLQMKNRGLYFTGPGGTPGPSGVCYFEGILFGGAFMYEVANARPQHSATVIRQNCKVEATVRSDGHLSSCEYVPTNTAGAGNHWGGDLWQWMTTPLAERCDGWLDEYADYQGPGFFKAEAGQVQADRIELRNMASRNFNGHSLWFYVNADANGKLPSIYAENVVMQPGRTNDGRTPDPRVCSYLGGATPVPRLFCSEDGSPFQTFPADVALPDSAVLSGTPGLGYVTPGYL